MPLKINSYSLSSSKIKDFSIPKKTYICVQIIMKKALAVILSFVLVVSNISLTYATHFCGGEAIESQLMLGTQDLTCGMIFPESTCNELENNCQQPTEMDSNCCDNEYLQFSVDENFNTNSSIQLPNFDFVIAFVHSFINPIVVSNNMPNEFLIEAPSLICQNFQVLHQVFLI